MKRENFSGKKVLVMGLGRFGGGVDVAEFASRAGAKVIVTDLAPAQQLTDSVEKLKEFDGIEFHLGGHDPADFEQANIVVANPAVPGDNEFLEIARRAGRIVTSQMNIFFELCPATIIGVTGANGKSTTTALTAHLLNNTTSDIRHTTYENVIASPSTTLRINSAKQSQTTQYAIRDTQYEKVWLSGNIGNQPLLTAIDRIGPDDLVVLELSSFQLEQLSQIQKAPKVALLTNLTPNHLDRHGTFANYCVAKESIFKFQDLNEESPAVSIFNAEDEIGAEWFEKYSGDAGRVCIKFSADDVSEDVRTTFPLPGRANLSNLAGAIAVACRFGIDDDRIRTCLPSFKALPHRLEFVEEINDVRWYNDSIATTPQSAIAALDAFDEPVIIIAGGYDKKLPFDELGKRIAERAKAAVLIGQTAEKIADAILNPDMSLRAKRSNLKLRNTQHAIRNTRVERANSLAEAVQLAYTTAESGDVVLLSPACASYDMFDNFQQRGQEFMKLVRDISSSSSQ
ncbi:MAG: UDP-N-acetylmuramoyl-L-alanine--D-glutamate ligase [Planctomycetes bacterium B3_Pla]|nr:MAG: UDP-N-acetylmuramoyl-L-alanine--D-glutamate ligase [Planctomycetes bacterium B3_Pla]